MKNLTALLAGLFFIFIAVASFAEEGAEDYIIGSRDVLSISVWGENDMQEKVEVDADGTIPFFYLGKVKVANLSISQVRDRLTAMLADGYIRNPVVIIKIEEYHSKEVQIQGVIANPGTYILTTNHTTLLKLISMAGGATTGRGNRAIVTRGEVWQKMEREKVAAPSSQSGNTATPTDGDTAFGWTTEPAGGCTTTSPPAPVLMPVVPKAPAPLNTRVEVDLRGLLDRGDYSQDIRIYPGDFVLISSRDVEDPAANYVFVEGAVRNPQQIEFAQGMTALQAVIQAGGFSDVASANRATLTRVGADGSISSTRVRLRDIQRGKQPDVPLQPGDRINVPETIF